MIDPIQQRHSKGDIVGIGGKPEDVRVVVVIPARNGVVATFAALGRRAERSEENGSCGGGSRPDDDFDLDGI